MLSTGINSYNSSTQLERQEDRELKGHSELHGHFNANEATFITTLLQKQTEKGSMQKPSASVHNRGLYKKKVKIIH